MPRVLLTGGRAPATLHLARLLRAGGARVEVAESVPLHLTGLSRAASARHRLPAPRRDPPGFSDALARLALHADLLVPTCEEVFWAAREHARLARLTLPVFPDLATLRRWHDKGEFARVAAGLGLAVPETRRLVSPADLAPFREKEGWVFKPAFSRFGTRTVLGPPTPAVHPTGAEPWVAQRRMEGRELCSFSVVRGGRITAHAVYPANVRAGRASVVFRAVRHAGVRDWVEGFVAGAGPRDGLLAFDFVEDAAGDVQAIECNPRLTSGVHLFADGAAFTRALLGEARPGETRPGEKRGVLEPREGTEVALKGALLLGGGGRVPEGRAALARAADAVWDPRDPLPALAQPLLALDLVLRGLRLGRPAVGASTADIEWNGEDA